MDADAAEKEAFLDELQQALWDDFLDRDLSLLINQKQFEEIKKLREQTDISDEERQNRLIATVEDLIPELEEIMLEKALDLKEAMVQERLAGMKEYFAGRSNELNKIKQAEQHLKARRWQTGSRILNTLIA